MDGLIYPDRRPHTGLLEYKNVARPIRAAYENGCVYLTNTMDFTNVVDVMEITWELSVDFCVIRKGKVNDFSLPPHGILPVHLEGLCKPDAPLYSEEGYGSFTCRT